MWGKTDFYVKLLTDKDPNSVPLSSLVHFKTLFIENGGHAYSIGNSSFSCYALIG